MQRCTSPTSARRATLLVAQQIHRLDESLLQSAMLRPAELSVLAAPEDQPTRLTSKQ
jgi:Flp pilus assembly CpaE family ATPase